MPNAIPPNKARIALTLTRVTLARLAREAQDCSSTPSRVVEGILDKHLKSTLSPDDLEAIESDGGSVDQAVDWRRRQPRSRG